MNNEKCNNIRNCKSNGLSLIITDPPRNAIKRLRDGDFHIYISHYCISLYVNKNLNLLKIVSASKLVIVRQWFTTCSSSYSCMINTLSAFFSLYTANRYVQVPLLCNQTH